MFNEIKYQNQLHQSEKYDMVYLKVKNQLKTVNCS